MDQSIGLVSLVVSDYDAAIDFFVGVLGFLLIEDRPIPEQSKRWVVVAPPGASGTRLLRASVSFSVYRQLRPRLSVVSRSRRSLCPRAKG
jgi:catechol 2,3-dioxygenase-like lactoylglutathione lyase family enzyme